MNAQELIDDAFGLLDPPELEQLDQAAALDPDLAARRDRLHQALDVLLDDGQEMDPPPFLAHRTIARVEQYQQGPRILDFGRPNLPFRWGDVAVAAAILVVGLLTLVPAVQRSRMEYRQLGCLNNIHQISMALEQYAGAHQTYPYINPDCPGSYVGAFALLLKDGGYLLDASALDCPYNGPDPVLVGVKDFEDLCAREEQCKGTLQHTLGGADYAYSLGYRDAHGGPPNPAPLPVPARSDAYVPLLADQPPHDLGSGRILDGNSPNHGGGGQNVLFTGGQAKWLRTRFVHNQDRDLYLNQASRPAPGLHPRDAVLQPGGFRFRH